MKKQLHRFSIPIIILFFVILALASNSSPDRATQSNNQGNVSQQTAAPENDSQDNEPNPAPNPSSGEDELTYEITYQNAETWVNSIGTVWVQVIVEVTNTGSVPLYLSSGAFDLEDQSGSLVKSVSMVSSYPDIIEPGEKGYYYEETTLDVDEPIELVVLPRPDIRRARIENIRYAVTDLTLSETTFNDIKMMGRVENTHDEEQEMVYVVAILFDSNGVPIGRILEIIMEHFQPGDKIGFEASSFSMPNRIKLGDIASHEVYAYPMQYQFN